LFIIIIIIIKIILLLLLLLISCHHGMACPQVVDGGDGLQIWRVAAIY
jgi:hypothetical protein